MSLNGIVYQKPGGAIQIHAVPRHGRDSTEEIPDVRNDAVPIPSSP